MCDNCNDFQQLLYNVERQHEATIAGGENDQDCANLSRIFLLLCKSSSDFFGAGYDENCDIGNHLADKNTCNMTTVSNAHSRFNIDKTFGNEWSSAAGDDVIHH